MPTYRPDDQQGAAFLIARFGPQAPLRATVFRDKLAADGDQRSADQLERVEEIVEEIVAHTASEPPKAASAGG